VYRTARVEAAKRAAPVLFTRPGQLYDVDPSRSSLLALAATEVSGSGPRAFDADQREVVHLYQLDIARPFEQWTVLARTGGEERVIHFADLGLPDSTDYVAWEFWTRRALGVVRDSIVPGPINAAYGVQVICLRPRVAHPQVLSTSRHVTCGGPDLAEVAWSEGTLSGVSTVVAHDAYEIALTEPAGYRLLGVEATGARVVGQRLTGRSRVVRLVSAEGGEVRWRIRYRVGR
jgi:hypothetical protein